MAETHESLVQRFAVALASLSDIDSTAVRLCEASRQLLDADGAAMTLRSGDSRMVVASTDQLAAQLEDLQDVVGEGPSIDALENGGVEIARIGADVDGPWPMMRAHGTRLGFSGTLLAIALRVDESVLGVLSAHRRNPPAPTDRDAGAFIGAVVGTALLQDTSLELPVPRSATVWASQMQVHQATGMVVAQLGVPPEDAVALLKGQAFAQNITLADVAGQVVERRISFTDFTIEGD